jgi:hypothetical protein
MQKLDLKDHVTKETKGRFVERKKRNGNGVPKCGGVPKVGSSQDERKRLK